MNINHTTDPRSVKTIRHLLMGSPEPLSNPLRRQNNSFHWSINILVTLALQFFFKSHYILQKWRFERI